ncbi:MAG: hypothetical protein QOI92_175 [Chloroflexota bacterium]|nr:hypothetical protein [Chloroflexota bacterium]
MPRSSDEGRESPHHYADPLRRPDASRETLIERQIRQAMEEGKFDNLPHQGKPLPNDDNPYAGEWGLAFRVLSNAGFAPPWIEADKEVRALLARRDAILARAAAGPGLSESARRRDRVALERLVGEINVAIERVNAEAPTTSQHRRPLALADQLARYDERSGR